VHLPQAREAGQSDADRDHGTAQSGFVPPVAIGARRASAPVLACLICSIAEFAREKPPSVFSSARAGGRSRPGSATRSLKNRSMRPISCIVSPPDVPPGSAKPSWPRQSSGAFRPRLTFLLRPRRVLPLPFLAYHRGSLDGSACRTGWPAGGRPAQRPRASGWGFYVPVGIETAPGRYRLTCARAATGRA
jgi:hypothetical protein